MGKYLDYYKMLGVSKDASADEIKKAYRKLAWDYHPDTIARAPLAEQLKAEKKMKAINEAYEVLGNKRKRLGYDIKYNCERKKDSFFVDYDEFVGDEKDNKSDDEDFCAVWEPTISSKSKKQATPKEEEYKPTYFDEEKLRAISDRRRTTEELEAMRFAKDVENIKKSFKRTITNLRIRKKDTIVRYILRNKKVVLVGTLMATVIYWGAKDNDTNDEINFSNNNVVTEFANDQEQELPYTIPETTETLTTDPTTETEAKETILILEKVHTVVAGDTLAKFSIESNTTQAKIKSENGMNSNNVVLGTKLIIPYIINEEDLSMYTQTAEYNPSISLDDYAEMYETNTSTLERLNPGVISYNNGYIVETDSLVVPNFITKEEYNLKKAEETVRQYTKGK